MLLMCTLALLAAEPDTARPMVGAPDPARTVVYPVNGRREGRWLLQRIAISGEFGETLHRTLRDALPDSLLDPHERLVMAYDLAAQLRWQVDFTRDIDRGDRYSIVFERFLGEAGEVRYGRVLGVQLHVGGEPVTLYAFDAPDGRIVYFDEGGVALERNFLSSPVDFERISSGFTRARFHPVLKKWRAHEGIDYAADAGTPVRSVADGTVLRAGWAGGYGRLVEVRHADGIVTRYGHLSAIAAGLRPGSRVTQGQVVGAVGATGLATGPHLHYELRVNGRATDPRKLPRDGGKPIDDESRIRFLLQLAKLRQYLEPQLAEGAVEQASR
ncbi:MAG TPA: M23 family metallopeptidase [Gemmatimonadales bacterium]|nr:M23 family metallopeptidase [Gemmatimonadales bacterium]